MSLCVGGRRVAQKALVASVADLPRCVDSQHSGSQHTAKAILKRRGFFPLHTHTIAVPVHRSTTSMGILSLRLGRVLVLPAQTFVLLP